MSSIWTHTARVLGAALLAVGGAAWAAPWQDGGRPLPEAREAVALLDDAASHGLQPRDYGAPALRRTLEQLEQAPDAATAQAFEASLDEAFRRFLRELHAGRLQPATLYRGWKPAPADGFDPDTVLAEALARHRLHAAVDAAVPPLPQYQRLREALARYQALDGHPAWAEPLPALPARPGGGAPRLEPGQAWSGLALLAQRLQALGDLDEAATLPPRHAGVLVEALRRFQERHGLQADGVLGRDTRAALDVSPGRRARQIVLALERLRWTPLTRAPRMIVVNLPEFVLRAYEVRDGRIELRQEMKVIVGKALDTRTPLLDEQMRSIEFSPYWNVPPSIARGELVPRLRRDPGYWSREGFEFVAPDGSVQTGLSATRLDAVLAGQLRIRQRPGPRNALGDIKFVFPNSDNIYLHHTPSTGLFERARRDFSHGCIRVEQPQALAAFVLEGQPGWDLPRIREAMARGESNSVRLERPLPVLIAYGTALVKDGRVHFFEDLYGHDRALDAALRARVAAPLPESPR
ncbi:L,D-transpeptidase family protein [Azohydromonas caseinilytica]|uniref:L,D-transpeptidase family protein n=1 Tax=Azohydromonas caseinilytica TaxID=2728836 RepID=A0A848FBT4_9BURK|nr:L,D-transpeptidase family protein [Azohydromonas caseinilytica]NML17657.1 L,D-transpeptidase family protein [Azohydromonas caseinilytica]